MNGVMPEGELVQYQGLHDDCTVAVPHVHELDPPPANGRRKWTRERIIAALQAFHAEHGRPPLQKELVRPLPAASLLTREFGSMTAAIEAAGLEPRTQAWRRGKGATRVVRTDGLVALAQQLEEAEDALARAMARRDEALDALQAALEERR
jgi:hypothetical protein